jgi:SAM-dependent methyltransferase
MLVSAGRLTRRRARVSFSAVGSPPPAAARVRRTGARALALAGSAALEVSKRLATADGGATLDGDRLVEWSFCVARLGDGPSRTLDFGADTGFLSLAAAERGHQVVAIDLQPMPLLFRHERVEYVRGDVVERPLAGKEFDLILNCSSVEHVGLAGRYGSADNADGDLEAMTVLRDLLADSGRMLLTVPVGRDLVCAPQHRIYGPERLPRLLGGYGVVEEQFWRKDPSTAVWLETDRETTLATAGSAWFYSLGLFVLSRA